MPKIEAAAFFTYPGADKLWKVIGGFGSLERWIPSVVKCTIVGQGVGAVRTVELADGTKFRDMLRSNADRHSFYELLDLPECELAIEHELSVYDDQPGLTIAMWRCPFIPDSPVAQEIIRSLKNLYQDGFHAAGGDLQ